MRKYTKKIISKLFSRTPKTKRPRRKKAKQRISWEPAPDIQSRLDHIYEKLNLTHLDSERIFVYRSQNSASRAYARTWGFPKLWQMSLGQKPAYIIEVLAEKFDRLSKSDQDRVLLHEIAHIPQNFSGSLLPHTRRSGKRNFHDRVEEMYAQYVKSTK